MKTNHRRKWVQKTDSRRDWLLLTKKLSSKAISKAVPDESVYGGHRSYAGVKRAVKRFLNQAERRDGKELIRKVGREA